MRLKPLLDKIVVKEITKKEENVSGIILPSTEKDKPIVAQVVAISEGGIVDGQKIEILVKVGDKVVFNKFVGNEVKLEGETYIILRQDDILAVIE